MITTFTGTYYVKCVKEILAKVVGVIGSTLGVDGRLITIYLNETIHSTKDGFKAIRALDLPEQIEKYVVKAATDVANRVAIVAGDGTTTSIVLLSAIFHEFAKIYEGRNIYEVTRGAKQAVQDTIKFLETQLVTVDRDTLINVCTISANNNPVLGKIIGEMVWKVGKNGATYIKQGTETKYEVSPGYHIPSGVTHTIFLNKGTVLEYDDIDVLLIQDKLDKVEDLKEIFKNRKTPLVIFCDGLEGDALSSIVKNMNENKDFPPVAFIKHPRYEKPEHKDYYVEDLAAIFGATIMGKMRGSSLHTLTNKHLGKIKKISATTADTKIAFDKSPEINARIAVAEELAKTEEFHRIRLSYLTIGVGTLYLSAYTPQEYKNLFDAAEDSLMAGLKAVEYGALPGGGRALCIASDYLDKKGSNTDYNAGYSALVKALKAPFAKMWDLSFPGKKVPIYEGVFGMNFKTKTEVDLVKAGVLDSFKSVTVALDTATSAACTMIETDTLFVKDDAE